MFTFLKRPLYVLSNKIRRNTKPDNITEEKWVADFSNPEKSRFDIKTENCYNANILAGSLGLELKKTNYIAWIETKKNVYCDQVIESSFQLESLGGYAAAGLLFRAADKNNYYMALISGKGYFRLDAVKNGTPLALIGWTEIASSYEPGVKLSVVADGCFLSFLVNGHWLAEITDDSVAAGRIAFVAASYQAPENAEISCRAWLDFLSVDSRPKSVEAAREKLKNSAAAKSRFLLAESFAALENFSAALDQLKKIWEQREEVARSVMATYTEVRTRRELFLAMRLALRLDWYSEAEEYIDACIDQWPDSPEAKEAADEKAKILSALERYAELKDFILKNIAQGRSEPALYALLGIAHWNLFEYGAAAAAWDRAFEMDNSNGLYAVNAAHAFELSGDPAAALKRFIDAGRIFLRQDNYDELGILAPKLLSLGKSDWEARALAGKWAFAAGDYVAAETGLSRSETLRCKQKPRPPADPAVRYLCGQLLVKKGKPREALRFFQEAARLAPDYGLFRLKLAELRFQLGGSASVGSGADPLLAADLKAALRLLPDDAAVTALAEKIRRAQRPPAKTKAVKSEPAKDTAAKGKAAKSKTAKEKKAPVKKPAGGKAIAKKPAKDESAGGKKTAAKKTKPQSAAPRRSRPPKAAVPG